MAIVGKNVALEEAVIREVNDLVDYAKELGVKTNFSEIVRFCLELSLINVANCYEDFADKRSKIKDGLQK